MKQLKYLSIVIFLALSCQSEPKKTASPSVKANNKDHEKTLVVPWNVQLNDSTDVMELRRDPAADMTNLQAADIVDALNIKYPEIKLKWIKVEQKKAVVSIADASYLTQQAGSQGARAYLAEMTYSLTEINGITAVDVSFTEGDHAQPGVYTRTDFEF
jgi:hypothetical protein